MGVRDDERWKQAQADYVADYPELDAEEEFVRRCAAAVRMYAIETEYRTKT